LPISDFRITGNLGEAWEKVGEVYSRSKGAGMFSEWQGNAGKKGASLPCLTGINFLNDTE